jgi:hypothetical protein
VREEVAIREEKKEVNQEVTWTMTDD